MRHLLVTLLLCITGFVASAQVSVSYFPFVSVLQLGTNTERLFWGDFKLATNTAFANMDMELSPKWNFRRDAFANLYAGAGISLNFSYAGSSNSLLNGYFADMGVRVKPFSQCRPLQIVFELSPYVNQTFDGGKLRTRLGLSWTFLPKPKNNKPL